MSCELAYVSGVLHGDGWCSKYAIGLRVADRDFAEYFANALSAICGRSIHPRLDERGFWLVRVGNKSGRFSSIKSYEPEGSTERAHWLRGLFDSEGNAQLCEVRGKRPYRHRRISLYSTDVSTLSKAQFHLRSLGINCRTRETKNSLGHKGSKVVHELCLAGKTDFESFARLVGSSIERKMVVIREIASSFAPAGYQKRAQLLGAAARRRKTMETTLPRVVEGVRRLMDDGVKPTQRNCRVIPGYDTIQPLVPQSKLVQLASDLAR